MSILEQILEYIFLPNCGVCGKIEKGYLCKNCEKELKKYVYENKKIIIDDGDLKKERKIHIEHIFKYSELVRKLIIQYKFNDKAYLYKTFCEFIVKQEKIVDFIKSYDIIIPVPIHKLRMRERGYNQSILIAKELAKKCGVDVFTNVLIKARNNKVQSTLSKSEREENTKDVYKLMNPEKINNKKVLIFDDVYTTGTTVKSCINEIAKGKPNTIGILTLARD